MLDKRHELAAHQRGHHLAAVRAALCMAGIRKNAVKTAPPSQTAPTVKTAGRSGTSHSWRFCRRHTVRRSRRRPLSVVATRTLRRELDLDRHQSGDRRAVFLTPAVVAAQIGAWSWVAVGLAGGALALLIALNFAEAGQPVRRHGWGISQHARGVWDVRWFRGRLDALDHARDRLGLCRERPRGCAGLLLAGGGCRRRIALIFVTILAIAAINIRGIRQERVDGRNALTIAKLTPLAIFIALGLPHGDAVCTHATYCLMGADLSVGPGSDFCVRRIRSL